MTDNKKSTDPGLSAAERKELRGHPVIWGSVRRPSCKHRFLAKD
jgi:hypothetical protein